MNFALYLLKFLAFVPGIVAQVEQEHSSKTPQAKTQIASDWLSTSTAVASAVLPPSEAQLANAAGTEAQSVLAATVAALHNANNPATASAA